MVETSAPVAPVLFEELAAGNGFRIGVAVLNAERSLNALSLPMIQLLGPQLSSWAADERIACVVLRGAGEKAFCAGGDVRSLRQAILATTGKVSPMPAAQRFFSEEYRLDYFLHTYAKPLLVWGSGVVMGGGLGLFAGASHRVVTETTRMAMPEISIGLFPDVGGSWFLQRMPRRAGLYLALTGASFNGADARYLGLADWFVRSVDRDALLQRLQAASWSTSASHNRARLSEALAVFAREAASLEPASTVRGHADLIAQVTLADSLPQLISQIKQCATQDSWLQKAADTLDHGSPTSAALIWALWHRAKQLSLAEVFELELVVAVQCCQHPDFVEGVRALLVDKDNKPRWTPTVIADVTSQWIDEHFASPWSGGDASANPLSDLTSSAWRSRYAIPHEV
jgi:enoyl-CoA hydratase/carnithine racemase